MHLKLLFILLFVSVNSFTQQVNSIFKVVPLGVKGGSDESNLSCYMLATEGNNNYVCLDAGTIHSGIEKAIKAGTFKTAGTRVLKSYIKGYFISHAHLDHVAGLIINSPDDTAKNIYGLPFCLDILKDKYFTWKSWANFTNEGDKPALNKYHYVYLRNDKETDVEQTEMHVKAYSLSHSNPYESTAFLIRSDSSYVLYLGDTGADAMENSDKLHALWQQIAPLVISKKLKAIFIETSFADEQPDKQLFGHLTPRLLMQEMKNLSVFTGLEPMRNLNVVITHIKHGGNHEAEIKQQLQQANTLKLHLIFPEQGRIIKF